MMNDAGHDEQNAFRRSSVQEPTWVVTLRSWFFRNARIPNLHHVNGIEDGREEEGNEGNKLIRERHGGNKGIFL